MNYNVIAKQVLENVGGKENVVSNATCMTRLRIELKDVTKVNEKGLKQIEGVLGIVLKETVQVVFGPGKVNKVGEAFADLTSLPLGSADVDENATDIAKANKAKNVATQNHPVQVFLKHIANIFVPLLPGIIAAGLINGICNIINVATSNAYASVWWYQAIRTMGWVVFAYLPIFVGMNAAREFKGSAILGAMAGGLCVANAGMPLLTKINDASITLPIVNSAFNPAAGGMIAALIAGICFAYLERTVRKFMPDIVSTFFTPLLTVIIGVLVVVLFIQPLGAFLTKGIFSTLQFIFDKLGIFGGFVLSSTFLPLVSVGLHQALTPIHQLLNDPNGPSMGVNYLLPILMMAGGGQVGAGIALYLKTKNRKCKQLTRDSIPVGMLGVGEPMMYAVTLPLGKPFITACLGSGLGGILASLFHLGTVSQGVSGLFGLLIVVPGTWLYFVIAMVGAYIGGFVLTWFFGVDEKRINEVYGEN